MPEPVQRSATRLWSQEVAIAEAIDGAPRPKKEVGYEFSNGRRFDDCQGVYEQPEQPGD